MLLIIFTDLDLEFDCFSSDCFAWFKCPLTLRVPNINQLNIMQNVSEPRFNFFFLFSFCAVVMRIIFSRAQFKDLEMQLDLCSPLGLRYVFSVESKLFNS